MDTELERFKTEIDPREFAGSLGFALDPRRSCRSESVMKLDARDTVVITRDTDGHYIYFSPKGGHSGTIIDLAKVYVSSNFGEVRKALRRFVRADVPVALPALLKTTRDLDQVARQWHAAAEYTGHAWLEEERGIPPEGTASVMVAYAISRADLVIIPTQGSQLDSAEAGKAIRLIQQQEKAFNRKIPYAVLYTRTNPAIRPRTLKHIQEAFRRHGIFAYETHMHEREAYRALFSFGGTLTTLDPAQAPNLTEAKRNARAFARETVTMLRAMNEPEDESADLAEGRAA
jgi:hypothetical protein